MKWLEHKASGCAPVTRWAPFCRVGCWKLISHELPVILCASGIRATLSAQALDCSAPRSHVTAQLVLENHSQVEKGPRGGQAALEPPVIFLFGNRCHS